MSEKRKHQDELAVALLKRLSKYTSPDLARISCGTRSVDTADRLVKRWWWREEKKDSDALHPVAVWWEYLRRNSGWQERWKVITKALPKRMNVNVGIGQNPE